MYGTYKKHLYTTWVQDYGLIDINIETCGKKFQIRLGYTINSSGSNLTQDQEVRISDF